MASSGKQKGDNSLSMSTSSETTIAQNQSASFAPIPQMESVINISDENDRNSSPSKTTDPARKKTFKIISSTKKGASGDTPADNDADSVDGLDESQTEDWSSEFCDSSKATDLDTDAQDNLTPDEVTTTTILVKQKPDRDSQSRFKVVKIETKEPFRRGRWLCHDFFDTAPEVTVEKNGSKVTADSIMSAISVNLSSSNSVHYVNDSSRNIFVPLSPVTELSKVFVPITPVITDQVSSNVDGFSTDNMVPFPSQPALLTSSGALSSSSSYQNIVHPGQGQTTLVQSLPQTNVFPYTQNASSALFQNGIIGVPTSGQSSQTVNVPDTSMLTSSGNTTAVLPNVTVAAPAGNDFIPASQDNSSVRQGSNFMHVSGVHAPQSTGSGQLGSGASAQKTTGGQDSAQSVTVSNNSSVSTAATAGTTGHLTNAASQEPVTVSPNSSSAVPEQPGLIGIGMDESTGSTKTLQGDSQLPPSGLYEAVEAVYMELDNNEDDTEEKFLMRRHSNFNPSLRSVNLRGVLDSPYHFYSSTVKSASSSPVPFIDQLRADSTVPVGQLFPPATTSPTNPLLPSPVPSGDFMESFDGPTMPMSSAFPDAFLSNSYYFPFANSPVQGPIFTPNSAFQPPPVTFSRTDGTLPPPMSKSQSQPNISAASSSRPMPYDALGGLAAQILGFSIDLAQTPSSEVNSDLSSSVADGKDTDYGGEVCGLGDKASARQSMSSLFGADSDDGESTESEGYVSWLAVLLPMITSALILFFFHHCLNHRVVE